jgi:hypothetical protein
VTYLKYPHKLGASPKALPGSVSGGGLIPSGYFSISFRNNLLTKVSNLAIKLLPPSDIHLAEAGCIASVIWAADFFGVTNVLHKDFGFKYG